MQKNSQNLTCWIILNSTSNAFYFLQSKIWHVMKFSIQNHAPKKHKKCKICHFAGVKWAKSWLLGAKKSQNLTWWKIFNSKSNALYFFQSKIWRVLKPLNQNLTRCENLVSKSDGLEIFNSKSDKFWNFFPKSDFYLVFFLGSDWMMRSSDNVNTDLF